MARTERWHILDALRGVAALTVVLWHWQHFVWHPGQSALVLTNAPWYRALGPLYRHGYLAVEFFFVLSGFVFHWLYTTPIATGSMSAPRFALLRFSRLYPLHWITLAVVLVLQQVYAAQHGGHTFVYGHYDPIHLMLNFVGVSGWIGDPWVFNGPFWSVSIELGLYALFFVVCRWARLTIPLVGLGLFLLWSGLAPMVGAAIAAFFIGGLTYQAYARGLDLRWALSIVVIAWALAWWGIGSRYELNVTIIIVVGALTVVTAALMEQRWSARRLAWLGELSYGIYLWHFPLQLAVVVLLGALGVATTVMLQPQALVAFVTVLLGVAWVSYHGLERPAQRWLRARWEQRQLARTELALAKVQRTAAD